MLMVHLVHMFSQNVRSKVRVIGAIVCFVANLFAALTNHFVKLFICAAWLLFVFIFLVYILDSYVFVEFAAGSVFLRFATAPP